MTEISNKTLALLMVAAMIVSLGGLFVSLDRLGKISTGGGSISGFVTGNATGKVNVTIASTATITLVDSLINFGTCSPPSVNINATVISSNNSDTGTNCTDGVGDLDNFPDSIRIRNDGNNYLNVTVNTNVSSTEFLGTSVNGNQTFKYATENGTGCMINVNTCKNLGGLANCCDNATIQGVNCSLARVWTNFTTVAEKYNACSNLTFGGGERNFTFWAQVTIPYDLVGVGVETKAAVNFSADSQ